MLALVVSLPSSADDPVALTVHPISIAAVLLIRAITSTAPWYPFGIATVTHRLKLRD